MKQGSVTLPNGENLHYLEWLPQEKGKAPTLLFIHGNFSDSQWWLDTADSFQYLNRHLVAIDLRGFGLSTYNNKCQRFCDWASDVREFCKMLGIDKCIANGWSFGGGITMKLAEMAPELVTKMILTCSVSHQGLKMFTGQKPCLSIEQIIQNPRAQHMINLMQTKNFDKMREIYEMLLFTHSKDYPQHKKELLLQSCFRQRCYPELLLALANSDIDITKIKTPCLMVHGKQDLVIPVDSIRTTGEQLKGLVVLENNAHMIPIESPKEYSQLIVKFISQP